LGSGSQEPLFAGSCGVSVHQATELVAECGHIGHGGFEIEVETVDYGGAEGTRGAGAGGVRTKDRPDVVCCCNCGRTGSEAPFGVGGASNRKENRLSVGGLTFCYIGPVEIQQELRDMELETHSICGQ
jgi:hypothetical protein